MLQTYTRQSLRQCLSDLDIGTQKVCFVHSSLMALGLMEDYSISDIPAVVAEELRAVLTTDGTLCCPGARWEYGPEDDCFDLKSTPVSKGLGVFCQHILARPDSMRSPNPIFSVLAVGKEAEYITGGQTVTSFGYDSAWDRLLHLDADMLFLGCDMRYATFVRYIEFRFGVPYLYSKLFQKPVTKGGQEISPFSISYLRYMHCPVEYDLSRFQALLDDKGLLRRANIGKAPCYAIKMKACLEAGIAALKKDLHYFLKTSPPYDKQRVPLA
jgi:aminoglycoside 3-N-acetyltransferase